MCACVGALLCVCGYKYVYTCVGFYRVCVHLIGDLGWEGGSRVWRGVEPQESDLCPSSHSSIPQPGVRLSALSIILALCGIPRIPRPPLLRPRCDAAVSHLVQSRIRRRRVAFDFRAVNRSFCSACAVEDKYNVMCCCYFKTFFFCNQQPNRITI